jgi:hypothetical protein
MFCTRMKLRILEIEIVDNTQIEAFDLREETRCSSAHAIYANWQGELLGRLPVMTFVSYPNPSNSL